MGRETAGTGLRIEDNRRGNDRSDAADRLSPLETIKREKEGKLRPTLRRITELAAENDVERIILGYPLNMDDTRGERAEKTEAFKELLEHRLEADGLNIPVTLWDERLSTIDADEVLAEAEVAAADRKQYIDKIAAALILEDYLKNGKNRSEG